MKTFHLVPIGLLLGLSVWAAANTDGRERRLTPTEIAAMPSAGPGAGTSGVGGFERRYSLAIRLARDSTQFV